MSQRRGSSRYSNIEENFETHIYMIVSMMGFLIHSSERGAINLW